MDTTVKGLQLRLMAMGFPLPKFGPDGGLGNETWFAIDAALDELELARAGKVKPTKPTTDKPFYMGAGVRITDADFSRIAGSFGMEEAKVRAVNDVEAAGRGFHSSGALVCLYEPHIAYKYSSGAVRDELVAAGLAYPKWQRGNYPATSFDRIDRCAAIAGAELAAMATSWGLGQIMGFNYAACGFGSALEMVTSFAESEANQLNGMFRFIKSNPALYAAIQRADWAAFASAYNGPGYKDNKYDTKLAAAYQRHKYK